MRGAALISVLTSHTARKLFFFARMRIDPAVSAGPIVTAFNDVLSTLNFFLVAHIINTIFVA